MKILGSKPNAWWRRVISAGLQGRSLRMITGLPSRPETSSGRAYMSVILVGMERVSAVLSGVVYAGIVTAHSWREWNHVVCPALENKKNEMKAARLKGMEQC